jgi:hypothetical protein
MMLGVLELRRQNGHPWPDFSPKAVSILVSMTPRSSDVAGWAEQREARHPVNKNIIRFP